MRVSVLVPKVEMVSSDESPVIIGASASASLSSLENQVSHFREALRLGRREEVHNER